MNSGDISGVAHIFNGAPGLSGNDFEGHALSSAFEPGVTPPLLQHGLGGASRTRISLASYGSI